MGETALLAGCAPERNVELTRIMDVRTMTVYGRRANLFKDHAGSGFV